MLFLLFAFCAVTVSAKTINLQWTAFRGQPYEDIDAQVGDVIEFEFFGGHNVAVHPSRNCDPTNSIILGDASPISYTITKDDIGSLTFTCQIGSHCREGGQIVNVFVEGEDRLGTMEPTPEIPDFHSYGFSEHCFSGINSVEVQGKGLVLMKEVEVGDYVRSGKDFTFSRVFSIGHLDEHKEAEFLKLEFKDGDIEVTSNHMLLVNGNFARASSVRVGDTIDDKVVRVIQRVKRRGLYAPFTEDGTIIVSGVMSSCYSEVLHDSWLNQHTLTHAFLAPFRWWCQLGLCRKETYTNGISDRYYPFIPLYSILQDSFAQNMFSALFSPVLVFAVLIDWINRNPTFLAVLSSLIAIAWRQRNLKKQKTF